MRASRAESVYGPAPSTATTITYNQGRWAGSKARHDDMQRSAAKTPSSAHSSRIAALEARMKDLQSQVDTCKKVLEAD